MALLGDNVPFTVTFTDSSGAVADPTLVTFWLREGIDGTELQWSKVGGVGGATVLQPDGMNAITRASTGVYALQFVSRKPERQSGVWVGTGTIFQSKAQTFFVRHPDIAALEP